MVLTVMFIRSGPHHEEISDVLKICALLFLLVFAVFLTGFPDSLFASRDHRHNEAKKQVYK